jgi:serine protease Do
LAVQENSNVSQSDLRAGDVITSANQSPVTNLDDLRAIAVKADKMLLINVIRGASAVFLVINRNS